MLYIKENTLMNLIVKIKNALIRRFAYTIVLLQSLMAYVMTFGKKPIVHFERPYEGQKILLLALYEKGILRPDIENLLDAAKRQGLYIIAINTLKIQHPKTLKDRIDCYIERPNFGRDFGSYKTGFFHFYKRGWEQQCERLLMLNDSLFYSKKNLAKFLKQMVTTEIEVLGATENHEIEHHLGSFCISIKQNILQDWRFKKFWQRYSNTDIRPIVIKKGEMKLSKILRRCVSSIDHYAAFFDQTWIMEKIDKNSEILDHITDYYRVSSLVQWKPPSLKNVAERVINRYLQLDPGLANIEANIEANIDAKTVYFVDRPQGLIKSIETSVKDSNMAGLNQRVMYELKNDLSESIGLGSQIHQNGILLHYLGMPLIKLDGLYRGVFVVEDIEKFTDQLQQDEKSYFRRLMFSKPYGGSVLFGYKRIAFFFGLI